MSTTHLDTELELVVRFKVDAADGVVLVGVHRDDGALLPEWRPGAHIDLHLGHDGASVRQYSLCGDPADRACWTVAILREPNGRGGSVFAHDDLGVGASVRARGPRNHFELQPGERYRFVAGGIGITPLIPMMAAAHATGVEWSLLYGGRSRTSMAFVDELLDAYGDRVTIRPQDTHGLLDLAGLLGTPSDGTDVYCCGPEPLLDAVEAVCSGWPPGAVHMERFTPKAVGAPVIPGSFEVEIASSGHVLTVNPRQSLLEVLQQDGLFVDSSCEQGTCGTCEVAVLDGAIDHRDSVLTADEQAEGKMMMVCVSRAACPRLVLDL